ncbi:MAG: diguanylate cyclase [Ectothiorhodospiraceae bacterium]|nr:diguanylate cyclase [Ectothiorhodospiraceae bacterium]
MPPSHLARSDGIDWTITWIKLAASGVSLTLLVIVAAFALSQYRNGDRQTAVAKCFALANLFVFVYVSADAAVRLDALLGSLDGTLDKIRLALGAVPLATIASIPLFWVVAARGRPIRGRIVALYAVGCTTALLLWVEHPALFIASDQLFRQDLSVFPDYAALAPAYFGLIFILAAVVIRLIIVSPLRRTDRNGWRLSMLGFAALLLAGAHDSLRELGVYLLPTSTLSLGFVLFQLSAFAFLALHYARTLREGQQQREALRRMTQMLRRDPVTGLFNKTHLQELLDAQPKSAAGGLLFIDLDNFKTINDRYGHLCGDAVINALATALRDQLRSEDLPCRWGGDEFLVYLPGASIDDVSKLAERLRVTVSATVFEGAPDLAPSMSMGYAPLRDDGWRRALSRADAALYTSKRRGRDRLTIASPETREQPAVAMDAAY